MISLMLQRLMTHPRRGLIVTTVTCLTGLIFLLPAVDSYREAGVRLSELSAELESHEAEIAKLESSRTRCEEQQRALDAFQTRVVAEEELDQLRSRIVEFVRSSHCTLRRITIGDARQRDWKSEGDDPLQERSPESAKGDSPYLLETRQLTLAAEGSLENVRQLLAALEKQDGLMHPSNMTVRRAEHAEEAVALEVSFVLMNLVDRPGASL